MKGKAMSKIDEMIQRELQRISPTERELKVSRCYCGARKVSIVDKVNMCQCEECQSWKLLNFEDFGISE
jgi:hypothetical protein